uniref:Uncharacterized protein n=1 Tax=Rhizophagus irregularis (strain DAOM 181602 / DAOM 197198 / MUCL 43194) TaxID=747089 RepID=U9SNL5_RHIID
MDEQILGILGQNPCWNVTKFLHSLNIYILKLLDNLAQYSSLTNQSPMFKK